MKQLENLIRLDYRRRGATRDVFLKIDLAEIEQGVNIL